MLFARPSPRITSSTFAAPSERNIAACPAELPRAGDDHRRAAAELPFARRRRVVNAGALEILAPLGFETMVFRARRDDDALRAQDRVAALGLQASRGARRR